MAKKYQPSGYYIINIDASDKSSGTPFTPETEDEKLLHNLLWNISQDKVILLKVLDMNDYHWCGFPTLFNTSATLSHGAVGSSIQLIIEASSETQLTIIVSEE